jgi:serine phosphatase RsbU (regulator of sigma subunit)/anti-sigma regulatory factor (Ser/Thr protein kinase)
MNAAIRQTFRNLTQRRAPRPVVVSEALPQAATLLPAVDIPRNDPLYAYCLQSSGVVEIEALKIKSEAITLLRAAGVRLLVPLVNRGEMVGMLQLGNRMSDQEYSPDDLRLLGNLAPQAAAALRVAQMAHQQQVEELRRERMDQEMRVAGIIQQTQLPKAVPNIIGWQFAAYWQPASTVGGDFYDFVPLQDGRLMVVIGDVTDKGVPAALVMASTRTILRAAAERLISPGEILRRANDVLHQEMPPKMFVTCLCAVLEPETGRLQYANAGHNASVQRTHDGVIELRACGMPLGLMPGMTYEEKETILAPNDTVFMYSDGLVEAHNAKREMFGKNRLTTLISEHPGGESLITSFRDALYDFAGAEWEQEDDVTFVVVQREGIGAISLSQSDLAGDLRVLDEFESPSKPGGERVVMERVAGIVRSLHLPQTRIDRLKTAVSEATMNAMEYGNHYQSDQPVRVRISATADHLSVEITDHGGGASVSKAETPDLDAKLAGTQSVRGWGLFLIKAMVDEVQVHDTETDHTVELILRLDSLKEGDHASHTT